MSHYSPAQKHQTLADFARAGADWIMDVFPQLKNKLDTRHQYADGYPVLVYRGMSGVACATALAQQLWGAYGVDIAMCYVRKPEETSHGNSIETEISWAHHRRSGEETLTFVPVFVDDFVSGGKTRIASIEGAQAYLKLDLTTVYTMQANPGYSVWTEHSGRLLLKGSQQGNAILKRWDEDREAADTEDAALSY